MSKPDLVFLTKENEASIKDRIKPLLEEQERLNKLSPEAQATFDQALIEAKLRHEKDKENEINKTPVSVDITL